MLKIGFSYEDTDINCTFSSESCVEIMEDFETDYSFIGKQLNAFLKQCGYFRDGEYMLMNSLTEDEYEQLSDYLTELRDNKKEVYGTEEA